MKRNITIIKEKTSLWVHFACCKTNAEEFALMKLKNSVGYNLLVEKYAGIVSAISNWIVKDISAAERLSADILKDVWSSLPDYTGSKEALINRIVETTRSYCTSYNEQYAKVKLN